MDTDLTAAIDAVARVRHATDTARLSSSKPYEDHPLTESTWRPEAERIIAAAAPLIEAAVRDKIARDIEAKISRNIGGHPFSDADRGMAQAARIVRAKS